MERQKPKQKPSYSCEICNYQSHNKKDYSRHLLTAKHKSKCDWKKWNDENPPKPPDDFSYACPCGKIYRHSSGLWKHKKKGCIVEEKTNIANNESNEKELIKFLLKENQEFKKLIIEQTSKMMELAAKPSTTTIHNTNCNNKQQFNLQLFLHEKCKNAMNISDFISSLEIESNDFEDIGKLGYVQGISNIFMKGLKDLDETIRPIHCSDIKRETIYIKDNDAWNKDENKEKMKVAIAMIAHKNFKYIPIWREKNPSSSDVTSKKNDEYMRIMNQVTTGITPDDDMGINKIIRNVANKVTIDRSNDFNTLTNN